MSEFRGDVFEKADEAKLRAMLDMAEELPLFHTPEVFIEATEGEIRRAEVQGVPYDKDGLDVGVENEVKIYAANANIIGFAARCAINLMVDMMKSSDVDASQLPEAEAQKVSQLSATEVRQKVNEARQTSSEITSTNPQTGEAISVRMVRIVNDSKSFLARRLEVSVEDELLRRTLDVFEEAHADPDSLPKVAGRYEVAPAEDAEMHGVAFFFGERDDEQSLFQLITICERHYFGHETDSVIEELHAKYPGEDQAKVDEFIALMKSRAEAERAKVRMEIQNPEIGTPSAADLDEFAGILQQLRSGQ